jgi:acylphosphatase
MDRSVSITVIGKVQGVFFRASTKDKADQLGVSGFVKNKTDGSVYIEARAEELVLQDFIEWCQKGPSRASVQKCIVNDISPKEFKGFKIERD